MVYFASLVKFGQRVLRSGTAAQSTDPATSGKTTDQDKAIDTRVKLLLEELGKDHPFAEQLNRLVELAKIKSVRGYLVDPDPAADLVHLKALEERKKQLFAGAYKILEQGGCPVCPPKLDEEPNRQGKL
jgi:hypothetical protein